MKSHDYQFSWRELVKPCLAPLLPVVLFSCLMQALVRLNALPTPKQSFDLDRTIIAHQAEASWKPRHAAVALLGDSSCLMGIDPLLVGEKLGVEVLNLGMVSYLSLDEHAQLLERYLTAMTSAFDPHRVDSCSSLPFDDPGTRSNSFSSDASVASATSIR